MSMDFYTINQGIVVWLRNKKTVERDDYMKLTMEVLPDAIGVCKLDTKVVAPSWAYQGEFFSITKTAEELSIVCSEKNIPNDVICEKG